MIVIQTHVIISFITQTILIIIISGEKWKPRRHGYKTPAMCTPVSANFLIWIITQQRGTEAILSLLSVLRAQRERESFEIRSSCPGLTRQWTEQLTTIFDLIFQAKQWRHRTPRFNRTDAWSLREPDTTSVNCQEERVPSGSWKVWIYKLPKNETECSECQAKH